MATGEVLTASTKRPVRLVLDATPGADELADALEAAIPDALWHDDVHGRPDWRRRITYLLAEEIRVELAA